MKKVFVFGVLSLLMVGTPTSRGQAPESPASRAAVRADVSDAKAKAATRVDSSAKANLESQRLNPCPPAMPMETRQYTPGSLQPVNVDLLRAAISSLDVALTLTGDEYATDNTPIDKELVEKAQRVARALAKLCKSGRCGEAQ